MSLDFYNDYYKSGLEESYDENGLPMQPYVQPQQAVGQPQQAVRGSANGLMGQLGNFARQQAPQYLMNQAFGKNLGSGGALAQYALRQGLGGAGMKALGMAIPGVNAVQLGMAALPFLSKGLSSLGKNLFGGGNKGPSAEQLAMGESKANIGNMRGAYGADIGTGQSMLDRYNPMMDETIGRLRDLSNRGLSSSYGTTQMAGAAAGTEAARRAAESRMRATGGMIGGGQALSGFGGINQAAVSGSAQGAYDVAGRNMAMQPQLIGQLQGVIGNQINRGDRYVNTGRQGMFNVDQNLYNMNAGEQRQNQAVSQANRDREAMALGGVANLAGTAMGMEQSRRDMNRFMDMYGDQNDDPTAAFDPSGGMPIQQAPFFGGGGNTVNPGVTEGFVQGGSGFRPEISGALPYPFDQIQVPSMPRNPMARLPNSRYQTPVPFGSSLDMNRGIGSAGQIRL
jgi:hypothetical protein